MGQTATGVPMGASFIIMLREGLEMALIVALLLAYLHRTGKPGTRAVWLGTAAGAVIAIGAGVVLFIMIGELTGRPEQIVEGLVALAAASVLTWMVFWMRRQARSIRSELEAKADAAIARGSMIGLGAIAFFAIAREGLETALFLLGASVGEQASLAQVTGGFLGLAIAVAIGYGIYKGSHLVNLRTFFRTSGLLVLLFAAGLLAKSIHEFQEAALLGSANLAVFDLGGIAILNPDGSFLAALLKGLLGWNPTPSIEMIVAYLAYALPVGWLFLRDARSVPPLAAPVASAPVRT